MDSKRIKIEYVKGKQFENNNFIRKVLFMLFIHPILNFLPRSTQKIVKKTHNLALNVIEHRTTHIALEYLYQNGYPQRDNDSLVKKFFHLVWMNTNNARGIRNRLIVTEEKIESYLKAFLKINSNEPIRLLSIASGSSRSFITVLKNLQDGSLNKRKIEVTFLDKNPKALEYSRMLVNESALNDSVVSFEWCEDSANNFLKKNTNRKWDIVEMVGLLDYFDDQKVILTFNNIYRVLSEKGILITANILPNVERPFVTKVMDWEMIYRTEADFVSLFEKSDFNANGSYINAYIEPMRVHVVVCAERGS